jgi:DNA-binding NarL/FixJ family response regulator
MKQAAQTEVSSAPSQWAAAEMDRADARLDLNDRAGPVLRLLIASEVRFLRESLGEILSRESANLILGYGADLGETLRLSRALQPDMILLDASVRDGPSAVRRLREATSEARVVVFAVSESVDSVLPWAEAGAIGYIPNTAATADLRAILADISTGRQVCSPMVAAGMLQHIARGGPRAPRQAPVPPALTPREMEIVRLVSTGLSNKEIARRLDIGLATTKSHVHNALAKLNLQRRGQMATWMHAAVARV